MQSFPRFRVRRVAAIFGIITAVLRSTTAAEPTPVILAVDGINMVRNLPVLLAERLGYFRAEGLAVTLQETSAGPEIDAQMVDGRIAAMVAYYHHTIVSHVEEGRPAVAVVTLALTPGYKVLVAPRLTGEIKSPADLKGRRVISGGAHSAKTTAANWIVRHAGLGLNDYVRLSTGKKDEIIAQLKRGEADVVIAPEPDASGYIAQGVAVPWLDLYSVEGTKHAVGSAFPTSVLYLSKPYAAAHPQLTQRLVNAFVRTLQYVNTHSPDDIAKLVPEMASGANAAPSVLREGVKMFACDGRMPPEAARAEAEVIGAEFPAYRAAKIEDTFDNRFVEQALRRR